MDSQQGRNPWLWAILFGLGCSAMAYGIHWNHGPHHDDYFLYSWSFPQLLDFVRIEVRPVGKLFGAVIFSQPEVVARLFGEAMLIGTSLLSGLLLYRLVRIRLAAVSVVFLCLVPFAGAEATTWTNALIHFMPAGFFALLALNLFLSSLRSAGQPRSGRLFALLSGVMLVLALGSIEPAANFYILFLGILFSEVQQHPEDGRYMRKMLALASLVIVISGVLIYIVFYVNAGQVTRRGVFEFPSLAHIGGFLMGFLARGIGGPFGQELIKVSFREGWDTLLANRTAAFLAGGTIATAAALNLFWKTEIVPADNKRGLSARLSILMAACLITTLASMLLPSVLLSQESGSPRLAYLPGISGILFLGFAIAWLTALLRTKAAQRIVLVVVTSSALVFSVHLLGYTRMYQLRYAFDRLQLGALQKAVPPESITGRDITFLPYAVYENFLGYRINTNPNFFLIGGFSSPNAVGTILEHGYPQTRINAIRPGYENFRWRIVFRKDRTLLLSGFGGDPLREVAPDNLILFRFCQNGTVELAEEIQFVGDNGVVTDAVTLPWAAHLREEYGTRTFVLVRRSTSAQTYSGTEKEKIVPPRSLSCELIDKLPADLKKAVTVNYGNKVSLLSVSSERLSKTRIRMSYYWRQAAGLGAYDTVFVHFTDDDNKTLFQGDHSFCENRPFSTVKGKIAKETQFIDVPSTATGKAVSVKIGIYDATSKSYDRLRIESAAGAGTDENNTRAIVEEIRL